MAQKKCLQLGQLGSNWSDQTLKQAPNLVVTVPTLFFMKDAS